MNVIVPNHSLYTDSTKPSILAAMRTTFQRYLALELVLTESSVSRALSISHTILTFKLQRSNLLSDRSVELVQKKCPPNEFPSLRITLLHQEIGNVTRQITIPPVAKPRAERFVRFREEEKKRTMFTQIFWKQ